MDTAAIIVKIVGLLLFAFTARSVYKHFREKIFKRSPASGQAAQTDKHKPGQQHPQHSRAEHALNAVLLYAWFIFMTALSLGMIVNN